jgi:NADPH:quinone reductase-like Zn-dependent oxidoreductase
MVATKFGAAEDVLFEEIESAIPVRAKGQLLLRVLASSLCPADVRAMSGDLDLVLKPKCWPYVPGIEMSGVVVECDEDSREFKVGCHVYANNGASGLKSTFSGGLGQFAVIDEAAAVLKPADLTDLEAAAIGGLFCAMDSVRAAGIKEGDRVLVLGGSSGIGTCLVQLLLHLGAGHVAATSTDAPLLSQLGVHRTIDYRTEHWWELPEYLSDPFDAVIEVTSGGQRGAAWTLAQSTKALRSGWEGGRFVSLDFGPSVVHNAWHMADFVTSMFWQGLRTSLWPYLPRYTAVLVMPDTASLKAAMELCGSGAVKIVLDPSSPFAFTLEEVKSAFKLQASGHAHGRVVIKVSE